jgi:hypothetical protein
MNVWDDWRAAVWCVCGVTPVREMVRGLEVLQQVRVKALNWHEHTAENGWRVERLFLGVHDEIGETGPAVRRS